MLTDLLRIITPDALAQAIKANPKVVQAALQKFETDFNRRRRERIVDNTSSAAAPSGGAKTVDFSSLPK